LIEKISAKCKKIKVMMTDVDGVLTDGGMYYTSKGDYMKKFHARDGMGVNILRRNKIPTIIVTKEKTSVVTKWAKKMSVYLVLDGVIKKEMIISKVCKKLKVKSHEIAFIGDDVNDLELMKKVGFSATPFDGIKNAVKISDYHCKSSGGKGAFREVVDLLIQAKFGAKKLY
jgi:YrbI family 3-deoxy-D-manno-octulosonate 8-phosphate phosphatase